MNPKGCPTFNLKHLESFFIKLCSGRHDRDLTNSNAHTHSLSLSLVKVELEVEDYKYQHERNVDKILGIEHTEKKRRQHNGLTRRVFIKPSRVFFLTRCGLEHIIRGRWSTHYVSVVKATLYVCFHVYLF